MTGEFRSVEELATAMRSAEEKANQETTFAQRAIGWGDHWMRPLMLDEILVIFGEVLPSSQEFYETEIALGASPEEAEASLEHLLAMSARGYRYGRCFSQVEPEGEYGSTHIINMIPITKAQFEEAQARNFVWQTIWSECEWARRNIEQAIKS